MTLVSDGEAAKLRLAFVTNQEDGDLTASAVHRLLTERATRIEREAELVEENEKLRTLLREAGRGLDVLVQACTAVVDAEDFAIALADARALLARIQDSLT